MISVHHKLTASFAFVSRAFITIIMISLKIIQTSLGKDFKMPNFKQIEFKFETADIEMKFNAEKKH